MEPGLQGKILFAGGTGRVDIAGPVYMYNKVDIFDAVTGAKSNGKLSKARSNIAVGSSGNKVVFAGGWYWDMMYSVLPSNNVDIYDASTGIWTKTTLSKKRENIGVATVGNKIIFAGEQYNGRYENVDVYDVNAQHLANFHVACCKICNAFCSSWNQSIFCRWTKWGS